MDEANKHVYKTWICFIWRQYPPCVCFYRGVGGGVSLGFFISQVWSNSGVLWIFPENKWKGWNKMGLFALSHVYFITGFKAVGGDYAITDALLCSLRYVHVKKFFSLSYPFQYLLVETSTMYAAHGVRNIGKCWSRHCLVTWSARTYSLTLTQCWRRWTTRNKLNWNLNQNSNILKMDLKTPYAKLRLFCFGHNMLITQIQSVITSCTNIRYTAHLWLSVRRQARTLTHLPLDKRATIPQTIVLNAFSWMKSFIFWYKFHWILFLRIQLTRTQHWFK